MSWVVQYKNTGRLSAFIWLLLFGLAIVAGLAAISNFVLVLLGLFAILAAIPLIYFATRNFRDRRGLLLLVAWVLMLISTIFQIAIHFPIGYLQEVLLFGLALVTLSHLWQQSHIDRTLRLLIFIYLAYLVICFLSSLTGRSSVMPAIWQFQYNFKWPLMFGLGCLIVWGASPTRQLLRIVQYSWVLILACIILEIADSSLHAQLFGVAADLHQNPILGFGLRYSGPFTHPGYLAITCALLAVAAMAQIMAGKNRAWLILFLIYLVLIMLSGQRQELLALAITMIVFVAIRGWKYWYLILCTTVMAMLISFIVLINLDHIPMETTLAQMGLMDTTTPLSERTILSVEGVGVANQYFPLGAGLGTYGGAGAQKFDQSLFTELGFSRYWWFRQGRFLTDTFWPSVIAESGYFGLALQFLLFTILWLELVRRTFREFGTSLYAASLTAVGALTLLLANSPSSIVHTDPRGSFLFWLLIGAIWQATGPSGKGIPAGVREDFQKESSYAR